MFLKRISVILVSLMIILSTVDISSIAYADIGEEEVKVPVILIHGYNSNPDSWKGTPFEKQLSEIEEIKDGFSLRFVNYGDKSRNDITSSEITNRLIKEIEEGTKECKCEQVDIVVHSMGGLLTRWFLLEDSKGITNTPYGSFPKGYFRDKVRKVIFLGTPHHGANVAFVNRLSTIFNQPELYYDTKGLTVDEYLEEYIDLYQEYNDDVFELWDKGKPISYESWLNEKHPDVLKKVKDRENELINPVGDKTNKLGNKRLKTTENYRYSGAFEEYSKIMLGRLKAKTEISFNNAFISEDNEVKPYPSFQVLPSALVTEKTAEAGELSGQLASAHNIVQDRLMRETFNIYSGVAEDGNLLYKDVIANPFLNKLNKEEYSYRLNAFKNKEHIPTYITVRTNYDGGIYNWTPEQMEALEEYLKESKDLELLETLKGLQPFITNDVGTVGVNFFTNIGLWKEEGHDMVVPLSSAQTVPIFMDRNVYYSQSYISHLDQPDSDYLAEKQYLNPLTGSNDNDVTYELSKELETRKSNPILLKVNKNSEEKVFNLKINAQSPKEILIYKKDKYGKKIGKVESVTLNKSDSKEISGIYQFNRDENKKVEEILFVTVNDKSVASSSDTFFITSDSENESSTFNKNDDYTYSIIPMETKTERNRISHKFKVINNIKTDDNSIADFTEKDFVLSEIDEKTMKEKPIYPFKLTQDKLIKTKDDDNIVLALDYSDSMRDSENSLIKSKNAAEQYIDRLNNFNDHKVNISVVGFSDEPHTFIKFTDNYKLASLSVHKPLDGGTALYDTIAFSGNKLVEQDGRKTIILLTDGEDSSSQMSLEDSLSIAKKNKIRIFPIALGENVQPEILETIAEETGGEVFYTDNPEELDNIYKNITEKREYIFNVSFNRKSDYKSPMDYLFRNEKPSDHLKITDIRLTGNRSNDGYFQYNAEQDGTVRYAIEKKIDDIHDSIEGKINDIKDSINTHIVNPLKEVKEDVSDVGSFLKGWLLW